jgi:hypothetical protein
MKPCGAIRKVIYTYPSKKVAERGRRKGAGGDEEITCTAPELDARL